MVYVLGTFFWWPGILNWTKGTIWLWTATSLWRYDRRLGIYSCCTTPTSGRIPWTCHPCNPMQFLWIHGFKPTWKGLGHAVGGHPIPICGHWEPSMSSSLHADCIGHCPIRILLCGVPWALEHLQVSLLHLSSKHAWFDWISSDFLVGPGQGLPFNTYAYTIIQLLVATHVTI